MIVKFLLGLCLCILDVKKKKEEEEEIAKNTIRMKNIISKKLILINDEINLLYVHVTMDRHVFVGPCRENSLQLLAEGDVLEKYSLRAHRRLLDVSIAKNSFPSLRITFQSNETYVHS